MHTSMTKEKRVKKLLLANRGIPEERHWPWLADPGAVDMRRANKFLLGASIDYQISADTAWENASILAEVVLGDPDKLWTTIDNIGLEGLQRVFGGEHTANCSRCAAGHQLIRSDPPRHKMLHRFKNNAAKKVLKMARKILAEYDGDGRKIWNGRSVDDVRNRIVDVGFGPELTNMVIGALHDTRQISGGGSLKADSNVCRVLGRVFDGQDATPKRAHDIAKSMEKDNTWALDDPLYDLGKDVCRAEYPDCGWCFLRSECKYYYEDVCCQYVTDTTKYVVDLLDEDNILYAINAQNLADAKAEAREWARSEVKIHYDLWKEDGIMTDWLKENRRHGYACEYKLYEYDSLKEVFSDDNATFTDNELAVPCTLTEPHIISRLEEIREYYRSA